MLGLTRIRPGAAAVAAPSRPPTIAVGTAAAATTVAPLMRKSRRDAPPSLRELLGMVLFSSRLDRFTNLRS